MEPTSCSLQCFHEGLQIQVAYFMRTIGSKTKGSFEDRLTIGSLKFEDRSIRIV